MKRVQCTSIARTREGAVFCVRLEGHEGDHRGTRAQWNEKGRVPITLRPDGTPPEAPPERKTVRKELLALAVEWIALNDAPGDKPSRKELEGLVSVALVADVFGASRASVAKQVFAIRAFRGLL